MTATACLPENGLYTVQATVTTTEKGYSVTRQVPTFFLQSAVQGIVDEAHAEKIAIEVVNPTKNADMIVHVSVVFTAL